jgi:predicted GNAT family N-acyltransferase
MGGVRLNEAMSLSPHSARPTDLSAADRAEFAALVRKGGEVKAEGLEDRIDRAASLVLLRHDGQLIGIAAVKNPYQSYRAKIARKSGIELPSDRFPFELGWVFVDEAFRGRHLSRNLVACALDFIDDVGIFATSRADNANMHRTMNHFGFEAQGRDFHSDGGDYQLRLFVRAQG